MGNHPTSPPPGSVPGSFSPEDISELMGQAGQNSGATGANPSAANSGLSPSAKPPKPITTIPQEGVNIVEGIGQGMMGLLPDFMQELLGIKDTDSPEEKAKKRQIFDNYQRLSADEQAYVQKKMQKEQLEKQQKEQEEMERKQFEQMNKDDYVVPTGKVTGEAAAGASNKQRTTQKLQSDRKKLSSAG